MLYVISILVGLILGKFFTLWVLVALTVVAVTLGICLTIDLRRKELAFLIALLYWQFFAITVISMWLTYYITTGQNWLSQLASHILR